MMETAERLYNEYLHSSISCLYAPRGTKEANVWALAYRSYLVHLIPAWSSLITAQTGKVGEAAQCALDSMAIKLAWMEEQDDPLCTLPFKATMAIPVLTPSVLADVCKILQTDGPFMSQVGNLMVVPLYLRLTTLQLISSVVPLGLAGTTGKRGAGRLWSSTSGVLLQLLRTWVDGQGARSHDPAQVWWDVVHYLFSQRTSGIKELQVALRTERVSVISPDNKIWASAWQDWNTDKPGVTGIMDDFFNRYATAVAVCSRTEDPGEPGLKNRVSWTQFETICEQFVAAQAGPLVDLELELGDESFDSHTMFRLAATCLQLSPYPWTLISTNKAQARKAIAKSAFLFAVNTPQLTELYTSSSLLFDLRQGLKTVLCEGLAIETWRDWMEEDTLIRPFSPEPVGADPVLLRSLSKLGEGMYQADGESMSGPLSRRIEGLGALEKFNKGLGALVDLLLEPHMGGLKVFVDRDTELPEVAAEEGDDEAEPESGFDLEEDVRQVLAPKVQSSLNKLVEVCSSALRCYGSVADVSQALTEHQSRKLFMLRNPAVSNFDLTSSQREMVRQAVKVPPTDTLGEKEYQQQFAAVSERYMRKVPVFEQSERPKGKVAQDGGPPLLLTSQGVVVQGNMKWCDTLAAANQARIAGLPLFIYDKPISHAKLDQDLNLIKVPAKQGRVGEEEAENTHKRAKVAGKAKATTVEEDVTSESEVDEEELMTSGP